MKYHKIKSLILNILALLPNRVGYYLYHKIQKRSFKNIDSYVQANEKSIEIISKILSEHSINLSEKCILEIGSGWLPIMPYLLKTMKNCAEVHTYDINRHYNKSNLLKVSSFFKSKYKFKTKNHLQGELVLPDFLYYYPNTDLVFSKIPANIKLVYSRFVLEHVKPADIENMHKRFYDVLNEGSYILHLISPSDHRSYSDSTLSLHDFLKFSQDEWNKIQTKFDYHNRLRLPQYLEIFDAAGFEVIFIEYSSAKEDSTTYKKFKKINAHSDFMSFTDKEILASAINVLLRKKQKF